MERFTKVRNIGKGNMGSCALARNNEDGKYYVIKQVDLTKMNKKERQQSLNEAHLLSSLRHPNIINYVDSFLSRRSDHLCIVMEFADSGDLSTRIKKNYGVNFRETQILDWLIQMTLSLSYIHQRKILHRDVKTQNVFLTSQNIVKLGDFGIARTLSGTYDQAKTFVGTPYYLSPELILERPYDHRSDVWALGVITYELLALKHPFNASSMKGLMQRILKVQYDPLPQLYTVEMRNIVPRLLTKDPAQRIKLDELLELPIIQRRLREWMLADVMPKNYIETLLQNGLLPSSIAALRKYNVNPTREAAPATPSKSLQLPALVPTTTTTTITKTKTAVIGKEKEMKVEVEELDEEEEEEHSSALNSKQIPTIIPRPPMQQLLPTHLPIPAASPTTSSSPFTLAERAGASPSVSHILLNLQPPPNLQIQNRHLPAGRQLSSEGSALAALRAPRRSQPMFLMYKNINGGYSALRNNNNNNNNNNVGGEEGRRVSRPLVSRPSLISAANANVNVNNTNNINNSNLAHATSGGRQRDNDASTSDSHIIEHRVRKRSQQESAGVASCLNPFFQRPALNNGPPTQLPYLSNAPNVDIKAMLQRAALDRAQRRALS